MGPIPARHWAHGCGGPVVLSCRFWESGVPQSANRLASLIQEAHSPKLIAAGEARARKYLREGVSLEALDAIAARQTDNESAAAMGAARDKLLRKLAVGDGSTAASFPAVTRRAWEGVTGPENVDPGASSRDLGLCREHGANRFIKPFRAPNKLTAAVEDTNDGRWRRRPTATTNDDSDDQGGWTRKLQRPVNVLQAHLWMRKCCVRRSAALDKYHNSDIIVSPARRLPCPPSAPYRT